MKQTFKIIPVEDYGVVVDETANANWYIKDGELVLREWYPPVGNLKREVVVYQPPMQSLSLYRAIATIGKRLDGVPLIELTDNWEVAYNKVFPKAYLVGDAGMKDIKDGFMEGYKANSNKYSEEDIKRALFHFANGDKNKSELDRADEATLYVQSLQKNRIPVSVELTMGYDNDIAEHDEGGTLPSAIYDEPKIKITNIETNTIIPKSVSYEKIL